ncbi:DUF6688 domain-containing protein [Pseudobutyrivibrio sp. MD2005]|uniref:DUF6688 domain-containing protein n=1 Tax=Pseudobutyrivibrio sp. MD2005 TaxID=1410616 RepID=UPI0006841C26|nr:DUF6688 family protein [Pseudobutyrivibrio sp. MD2005]
MIIGVIFEMLFLFIFLCVPAILSLYNLIGMFHEWKKKILRNILWLMTFVLGELFTFWLFEWGDVCFGSLWSDQLYNAQLHQPIWSGGVVSVAVISLAGVVGASILIARNVNELPPLISVLCISSMYLTLALQVVWSIQCLPVAIEYFPYLAVPVNLFFIAYTIIIEKINEWDENQHHQDADFGKNDFIKSINNCLIDSSKWPVFALILSLPLLGVFLIILVLFGQEPNSIIKAWTETSDWTFSLREGPQNLYYDEHYLCTVAAGGHKKVVKPLRMGERHGHPVIVNRQLLIANAFENVLEERMPKFHRAVRNFYDKYGFPIADYIRTNKVACDITYFIMKPLEWIFLIVLYLVDANPEDRIAIQYMPRKD